MGFKNKEREKEYKHEWYLQNKEKTIECAREWAKNNRDKRREINKKYYRVHQEKEIRRQRIGRKNNPKRTKVYDLIHKHPELYPLDDKCIFCDGIEKLERGHLDYENNGYNYVTVCHQCNRWMDIPIGIRGE